MKHVLLPHGPYLYLPSGARTRSGPRDLVPGMNGVPGFHDPFLTRHNEQRYLLQLQFVDRLIGRLLEKLESEAMYDRTLLVVTADHGISWQSGVRTRRSVSLSNVEELTPVPLIVKAPGQRRGRISDAYARTLDVTPTIADVLGLPLGYRADGSSAFGREARRRQGGAPGHARLQRRGTDLRAPLGGAQAPRGQPAPTSSSARVPPACTPGSARTRACSGSGRRRWRGPSAAASARRSRRRPSYAT